MEKNKMEKLEEKLDSLEKKIDSLTNQNTRIHTNIVDNLDGVIYIIITAVIILLVAEYFF